MSEEEFEDYDEEEAARRYQALDFAVKVCGSCGSNGADGVLAAAKQFLAFLKGSEIDE